MIRKSGKHLEITNLVIPNQNDNADDFIRMVDWIADELGEDTVFHISGYFPTYKLHEPPTPQKMLYELFNIARKRLNHVYLGNVRTDCGQNTYCQSCNTLVISRSGYRTDISVLDHNGLCLNCGAEVIMRKNMR